MSQTKQWAVYKDNTTRNPTSSTTGNAGSGGNTRLFTGRYGAYDYDAFLQFTLDWANVGTIVKAVLSLYTDDGLSGIMPATTTESPQTYVKRLTANFTGGASTSFVSGDYTNPASTTSGQKHPSINRASNGLTSVDITDFVELWAPKTVKKRSGAAGSASPNYGIGLLSDTSTDHNIALWSNNAPDPSMRPIITLTYEYGATVPDTPTSLTPSGSVASLTTFNGVFSDVRTTDELRYSEVEVYTAAATNAGQTVTGGSRVYNKKLSASRTEIDADAFTHDPGTLHLAVNTTWKWRVRVYDNEGQVSLWTDLVSFSLTNTPPNNPVLTPVSGTSKTSLDGVLFGTTGFSDPENNGMLAYQIQMSRYTAAAPEWDDPQFILWDTGKRYIPLAFTSTAHTTKYGGSDLTAGTYWWRMRVWDGKDGSSDWTYASITTTTDFAPDPDLVQTAIQQRPRAPWRIVIKAMGALRGPGATVAILVDAKNVGASILYNSPGELHFTLPKAHPQISVIEPKQTHYSVQFRQGDGWREVFAGLMWDFDASDTDVVFYGIDYLALLDYMLDERYDQSNPDKPAEKGGSKYVTAGKNSINYIVTDQLNIARNWKNSPVGFITVGPIATMTETLTVFSTYSPSLSFITGLLDSHRAGQNKKTRLSVRQKTGGGYEFTVVDDPGQVRDNLRLKYGELVQGYRVIPFGTTWASRISAIGRAKDGIQVLYKTATAPGIDEAVWGHFAQVRLIDGISDANDLQRRVQQAAVSAGKLGKSVAVGIRSLVLQPRDGYDVCDQFPLDIQDGSVDTTAFGSGYWNAMGITWECAAQTGKQTTTLTLQPREDSTPPSNNLLTLQPISPQREWQIGWHPPTTFAKTSLKARYYLDQKTGKAYKIVAGHLIAATLTGTP